MSEPVYLLLAIALVTAYLLLTSKGRSRRVHPRTDELDRLARETMSHIRASEHEAIAAIDDIGRRRP